MPPKKVSGKSDKTSKSRKTRKSAKKVKKLTVVDRKLGTSRIQETRVRYHFAQYFDGLNEKTKKRLDKHDSTHADMVEIETAEKAEVSAGTYKENKEVYTTNDRYMAFKKKKAEIRSAGVRISRRAVFTLACAMEYMTKDLAHHAMFAARKDRIKDTEEDESKGWRTSPRNLLTHEPERLDTWPWVSALWHIIEDKARIAAAIEEDSKDNKDVTMDTIDKEFLEPRGFRKYVDDCIKDVRMEDAKLANAKIRKALRPYLSGTIVKCLARISPMAHELVLYSKDKTIQDTTVRTVLRMWMIDAEDSRKSAQKFDEFMDARMAEYEEKLEAEKAAKAEKASGDKKPRKKKSAPVEAVEESDEEYEEYEDEPEEESEEESDDE